MKISVIVPVFNVEKYLYRCVTSIQNQTLKDIEIILVDDGSTDSSGFICDEISKHDERIKVIHKANGGLSSARNEGIKQATSDLIGFVDSDDWITEDMFEYLYNLQQKTQAEIVSCSYHLAYSENEKIKDKKIKEYVFNREEALNNYMKLGLYSTINDYSVCKKLYKKSLFSYVLFPQGLLFEDMATNFELIQHCNKYVYSTKECYLYFQNSVSITRNQYSKKHNDLIIVSNKLISLSNIENENLQKVVRIQKEKAYFSLLVKIARFGYNDDISEEYIRDNLLQVYKENFDLFIKSPFSFKRKIVGLLIYFNWPLAEKIFRKKK